MFLSDNCQLEYYIIHLDRSKLEFSSYEAWIRTVFFYYIFGSFNFFILASLTKLEFVWQAFFFNIIQSQAFRQTKYSWRILHLIFKLTVLFLLMDQMLVLKYIWRIISIFSDLNFDLSHKLFWSVNINFARSIYWHIYEEVKF